MSGQFLSIISAAKESGVCKRTIQRLVDRGELPFFLVHGSAVSKHFILRRDLEKWHLEKGSSVNDLLINGPADDPSFFDEEL